MPTAAPRRPGSGARRAGPKQAGRSAKGKAKRAAPKSAAKRMASAVSPSKSPSVSRLAGLATRKALKALARKAARSGARALRSAADRTAITSKAAVETALSNRLPIQVSIDVAVPPAVAWEEWVNSSSLTEGVHRIENVERDGNVLIGTVAGPRSSDWDAEIVDERSQQSFAWRSHNGSDCAGLVTFHRLSDRLTRIELDLDVLPTSPAQALSMSLHLAHRRAQSEMRRFKARVEFINPDVYESDANQDGDSPNGEREG